MQRKRGAHKNVADSYMEVRLVVAVGLAFILMGAVLPAILRAIDVNGDNLDDAWEAHYGLTTNAYAAENLVGWWQMDGPDAVTDRTSHRIDGVMGGFPTNAYGSGVFSNALYFSPQAHVDFPTNSALTTSRGFTFSTWIKSDQGATNPAVIATWADNRTNAWSVGIATNGMAQISFSDATGAVQTVGPSINSATLYDGAWHHLAATWAVGEPARVYVDGENQGSDAIAGWNPGPVASFNFGTPDDTVTNQPYVLDEVRLYNRALGPNEVTQLPVTYTDLNGNGLSVWEDYQRGIDPTGRYDAMALHSSNAIPIATDEPGTSDFTPWMTDPELKKFMEQFDSVPPGHHPNYWDKGHWINAVEGRWHNGAIEFRITYGLVPKHKGLWWYWYLGIGERDFKRHAAEFAAQGYTLLDANSFVQPNGIKRFQGVWHKVTLANAPATPPSTSSK